MATLSWAYRVRRVRHGFWGSAGRLRGELTEFVGRRSELALVRQALLVPDVARRVNDIAQFPLARVVAVLGPAPAVTSMADPGDDGQGCPGGVASQT